MNYPSITIDLGNGSSLSLAQTGPATATMAEGGSTYQLENVVASATNIDCDVAGEPFVKPHIHVDIDPTALVMTISKSWIDDGTTTYPMTAAEFAELQAFLKAFSD